MGVFELRDVIKSFGATSALDGLDLFVRAGRIHGYLGPNGAGKSTTLRLILGLAHPDRGEVRVFGLDPTTRGDEVRRRTATAPADVTLWPTETGGDVLATLGSLRGDSSVTRRNELVERFGLDPSRRCRDYSSGQRQKVILISALQARADLYLLDEPTNGLDPLVDEIFREVLREERARGRPSSSRATFSPKWTLSRTTSLSFVKGDGWSQVRSTTFATFDTSSCASMSIRLPTLP